MQTRRTQRSVRRPSQRPTTPEKRCCAALFKHKRKAIEAAMARADGDGDGHLTQVEFVRLVKDLGLQLGDRDVAMLWKRHAQGDGFMQTHLDYKQFLGTFVGHATFSEPSDLQQISSRSHTSHDRAQKLETTHQSTKTRRECPPTRASSAASSVNRLTLDCSSLQHSSKSLQQSTNRSIASRCQSRGNPATRREETPHRCKNNGIDTARTSVSKADAGTGAKTMMSMEASPLAMKQLADLKDNILANSLAMLKKLKHVAPGGAVSREVFFDTLEEHGISVSDAQILVIVRAFTDQQGRVQYPVFFKGFALLKDHHDEDYAGGYFHDGTYEAWQMQQQRLSQGA